MGLLVAYKSSEIENCEKMLTRSRFNRILGNTSKVSIRHASKAKVEKGWMCVARSLVPVLIWTEQLQTSRAVTIASKLETNSIFTLRRVFGLFANRRLKFEPSLLSSFSAGVLAKQRWSLVLCSVLVLTSSFFLFWVLRLALLQFSSFLLKFNSAWHCLALAYFMLT